MEVKNIDHFDELVVTGEEEPGNYDGYRYSHSPKKGVNVYKYDA